MTDRERIRDELRVLWDNLAPKRYLLTLENSDNKNKFFDSVESLGLSNDENMHVIESKKVKGTFWQVCADIFKTHHDVTEHADINYHGQNILIFEDDCRFLEDADSLNRLKKGLEYVASLDPSAWQVFTLGQSATGPCDKLKDKDAGGVVVKTMFPASSHSYILNGNYIRQTLEKISTKKWRAPWYVEYFVGVPYSKKLAIYPNVTHQIVVPRMQKSMPFAKHLTFHQYAAKRNAAALAWRKYVLILLVIISGLGFSYTKIRSLCKKKH